MGEPWEGSPKPLPLPLLSLLCLIDPHALEAVQQRRRMLPEALHARLREVDRVRREEPEVRHVLEDHDLDLVVDLLALLLIQGAPSLFEHGVELRDAPRVPVLTFRRVER